MIKLSRIVCLCAVVLALTQVYSLADAANLPTGGDTEKTWDFTVSGADKGSAYLTFYDDNTIWGYMVATSGRGTPGQTVTMGTVFLAGEWNVNEKGRIVGYLQNDPEDSVRMDITRFEGTVSKTGTKFNFKGETVFGKINFSGIPAVELGSLLAPTFSNEWLITLRKSTIQDKKVVDTQTYLQVFEAVDAEVVLPLIGDLPNLYFLQGQTANLCLYGFAALSHKNKLTISLGESEMPVDGCGDVIADPTAFPADLHGVAATGKLNVKTGVAKLRGSEEDAADVRIYMVTYLGE